MPYIGRRSDCDHFDRAAIAGHYANGSIASVMFVKEHLKFLDGFGLHISDPSRKNVVVDIGWCPELSDAQ